MFNDLIIYKLNEIVELQDIIKSNELDQSVEKLIISVNMHYLLFLRDEYGRKMNLEETYNDQSKLVNEFF